MNTTDSTTKDILNGINLILKYESDATFATEHDEIFFGSADVKEAMTPEELILLEEWGWFEDQDSMKHYV
jgi:hypothetical protein